MSDWQPGDRALCVDDSPCRLTGTKWLTSGAVYIVEHIGFGDHSDTLVIAGDPSQDRCWCGQRAGWSCDRFRKIRPDEHGACEPEFVKLLKRTKVTA
jgi:hypothetical protein